MRKTGRDGCDGITLSLNYTQPVRVYLPHHGTYLPGDVRIPTLAWQAGLFACFFEWHDGDWFARSLVIGSV